MTRPTASLRQGVSLAARVGYVAKGVIYLLIGGFAFMAATGLGGDNVGSKGAINQLITKPFGDIMLGLLGVGLFAYALWRLLQALMDTESLGAGLKGIVSRLAFLVSSLTHASLGIYCVDLLSSLAMSSGDSSPEDRTAQLMGHQGGIYLITLVGLVLIGVGFRQLVRAYQRSYLDNWYRQDMSTAQRRLAEAVTRWGLTARGLVFQLIGGLLCLAAWRADPDQAEGLGGALNVLAAQPFGPWLLGAIAIGLFSYGLYCLINAAFRDTSMD